jgi:hypothetical protein
MSWQKWSLLGLLLLLSGTLAGAEKPPAPGFENDQLRLWLRPRTPNQMAAFYEARGFPRAMVKTLKGYCFITVGIRNKSQQVIWLDLAHWRFLNAQGEVERMPRQRWPAQWQAMGVPQAAQSTFRWTLLPEVLDFRPDEREGGNVVLRRVDGPFTLVARFAMGQDRQAGTIEVRVDNLHCAEDPTP